MGQQLDQRSGATGAPMTFGGTARRIWQMTERTDASWARALLAVVAVVAIAIAWVVVAVISVLWAVFVWPFRRLAARRQAVEDRGPHSVKHANIVT